jgi:hypothetical protein
VLAPTLHTLQIRSVSSQSQIAQIDVLRMYPRLPKSPSPHPLTQASQSLHVDPHGPALCSLIETLSILIYHHAAQPVAECSNPTRRSFSAPDSLISHRCKRHHTPHPAPLSERHPKRVPRNCTPAPRRDGVFRITIFGELVSLLDRQ